MRAANYLIIMNGTPFFLLGTATVLLAIGLRARHSQNEPHAAAAMASPPGNTAKAPPHKAGDLSPTPINCYGGRGPAGEANARLINGSLPMAVEPNKPVRRIGLLPVHRALTLSRLSPVLLYFLNSYFDVEYVTYLAVTDV